MRFTRSLLTFFFLMPFVIPDPCPADWKDDVGFTQLFNEYGAGLEDGTGVNVSQVEVPSSGNYFPDISAAQFSGISFTNGSTGGTGTSSHANGVGGYFFGDNSISQGITDVTMYETSHWVYQVVLQGSGVDPLAQNFDLQNHSWIGSTGLQSWDIDALQRVDFLIDQHEMTMSVGLGNGTGPVPALLAPSFNAIAVGKTNGSHSYGTTTFYTSGRTRPDIVAPSNFTSNSSPMIGSAAALLIDAAPNFDARRTETIRAIIMAGATKNEFVDWDRTTTRPLDEKYGAGELNIYNSYQIMTGGQFNGSTSEPVSSVGDHGYDYVSGLDPSDTMYYQFVVSAGESFEELSILLTWNMEITDQNGTGAWSASENIADMNLAFYDSSTSFLGTLLDTSVSTVDNKEHFYFTDLGPGVYTLVVTTDRDQDFAIAWRGTLNAAAVPEPSGFVFVAALSIFAVFRRRRRCS